MNWWHKNSEEIQKELFVELDEGLSNFSAKKRLETHGLNQIESASKINPLKLFLSQFKDVLLIVLFSAAVVSWLAGKAGGGHSEQESLLIIIIVFAIAFVGFFNEYKAEKTVDALKKLVSQKARVRREGRIIEIDSVEIVPGDVVLLEEGTKVPADIRLLKVWSLQVNEASLTGESLPVSKNDKVLDEKVLLADQKNMAFAGTFINQGTAEGIVIATGQKTELGKIAGLVSEVKKEQTPMQRKLDELGKKLGLMILILCALVFVVVMLFVNEARDKEFVQRLVFAFTAAVALAVAAIPEGLAFVVRISLAMGARRMAGRNALVRRLSAVEALGSTDVICSDKTGTLTKGEMTVRAVYSDGISIKVGGSGYSFEGELSDADGKNVTLSKSHKQTLQIGLLCNNARFHNKNPLGDPTEAALIVSASKAVFMEDSKKLFDRVHEVPFNSDRKLMSTIHKHKGKYLVASKGSVESVLKKCKFILRSDGSTDLLNADDKVEIMKQNIQMSAQALRVLAFAYKECDKQPINDDDAEKNLVFTGLQAMMDPPRKEVAEVIRRVQAEAGMRVVMITGDHVETAKAIASEIGLQGEAIGGAELERMTQKEFEKRVDEISVYARVTPEHKIRIVQALKKRGHQVAMTGDGVNDAPAIKAADIGIAMGISGTDASKEAADLILLDDKFITIIHAIEEGRGIFDNVRKFVNFLISCNIAEVIAILFGIIIFNNLLLTAAQLLFINIVTDGLPAIALGSDPARKDVLKIKPSYFQQSILTKRVWVEIFLFGSLMSALLLFEYWRNSGGVDTKSAVTAAFVGMIIYEFVRLIDIRTDYKIKWFSNPLLSISMLVSLVILAIVVYVPFVADYFKVGGMMSADYIFIAFGSVILITVMKLANPILDRTVGYEN